MRGTVAEFDAARGLGVIEHEGTRYPFHCTALIDGTRTVDVGAEVDFEVVAGGMGRWEAARIDKR